jgi:hypothetical protein
MNYFRNLLNTKPLAVIITMAAIIRLVAVLFSKGWGMHDDHFLVIEPAQSWIDGIDYNSWLPMFNKTAVPSGHSLLYSGIHYILFSLFEMIGIRDPQSKMYIIRLIHALLSISVVYLGYKITEKLSDVKTATISGLLIALLWFMPFMSVRNLVELVCIPFLIWGIWLLVKRVPSNNLKNVFLAGFLMAIGFSFRFQTITFAAGVGLVLLYQKKWKETIAFGVGYALSVIIVQGGIDYYVWRKPFAEFLEYTRYNMANANEYITNSWYTYILLILGLLIPPVSIFLSFGFFRMWKKHLIIFLPTLLFFAFHSFFPNKQERFILPAVPFIIILGTIGWEEFKNNSKFWQTRPGLLNACWIFFWSVNIIMLIPVSTMYSKKARVESMTYLAKYTGIGTILLEDANNDVVKWPPEFYLNQWVNVDVINISHSWEAYQARIEENPIENQPRFVLFFEEENLQQRVYRLKTLIPDLVPETTIEPGFMDKLLYWLNPMNANQTIYIYRNTDFFPEKKSADTQKKK